MDERQKRRAKYKTWKKGYYHLSTDGKNKGIFHKDSQYVHAVNSISLLNLLFPVNVHSYEVMRSHLHLLLSGTGATCVAVFDYLKARIDRCLREDGCPPLPDNYDFRLVPVESEDQMRQNFVYIARNASEARPIRPGTYLWGSSMILFSDVSRLFEAVPAGDLSVRELRRIFRTHRPIPPDRPVHPGLRMALPQGFVDTGVFYRVFPTATQYETMLVKDYESFVEIADLTGEDVSFSLEEAIDIVDQELTSFGKRLNDLTADDRSRLAVELNRKYRLDASTLSKVLFIPAHILSQVLRSKRYGK